MKLTIEVYPRYDSEGNITLHSSMGLRHESQMSLECTFLGEHPLTKIRDHAKEISIYQKLALVVEKEVETINQETLQVSKPSKSKSHPKLPYYYLREGDFLPAPASEFYAGKGISILDIEMLKEAGNLFLTKEEATVASEKVRAFLASINNPWCL